MYNRGYPTTMKMLLFLSAAAFGAADTNTSNKKENKPKQAIQIINFTSSLPLNNHGVPM